MTALFTDEQLGLQKMTDGPFIGNSYKKRMEALMRHFHTGGLPLSVVADAKHLNRKVSTLQRYCRRMGLVLPDYCPLALRPPKPPRERKRKS